MVQGRRVKTKKQPFGGVGLGQKVTRLTGVIPLDTRVWCLKSGGPK